MTFTNFTEIWDIATELKAYELKKMVVQFVVDNHEHLVNDDRIAPELMMDVFRVNFYQRSVQIDTATSKPSND